MFFPPLSCVNDVFPLFETENKQTKSRKNVQLEKKKQLQKMRIRVALEILRQFSTLNQHCGFELSALFRNVHPKLT